MIDVPSSIEEVRALPSVDFLGRWRLPDQPGLYFGVVDDERVAYVGSTLTSLRKRWIYHHRAIDLLASGRVSLHYLTTNPNDPIRDAELAAIDVFAPVLNVMSKRVRPVQRAPVETSGPLVLLSIAAEDLGYSSERLRQLLKAGVVEGTRRGKLWFLRESEVETLRGQLRKATGRPPKPRRPA